MLTPIRQFIADTIRKNILIIDQMPDRHFFHTHSSSQLFLQQKNCFWHLSMTNDEIQEKSCLVIPADYTFSSIASAVCNAEFLLFEDLEGQFAGYIASQELLERSFEKHGKTLAYLHTVLDTIDESCTVIDQDAAILYWTKGAESLFSLKEEDVVGKKITDFFDKEHLEILRTLYNGTSLYHSQHHARNDLIVMINSNPVYYSGSIIGAVVSESDITSQVRMNDELYATSEKLFLLEEEVRKTSAVQDPFNYIKGNSSALKRTIDITKKAAATEASILIYGESGVGKELFAKAIHNLRENKSAPFVAINCGAIPESLFESEIFGYEKGAFSGADQRGKKGKIELARSGTLLLDEIGEMPLEMQVKFLRVLQERKYYPVGGTKEIEVDFRIIAATNRDLRELVAEGKFREDLYYRLNVVNVKIPPLRERFEDIIELTNYFLYEFSIKYNRPITNVPQTIMQKLLRHSWPGNIRELRNIIERLVVFSDNGNIHLADLPVELNQMPSPASPAAPVSNLAEQETLSFNEQLQQFERNLIIKELKKVDGNKAQCAKNLQITRATLYNKIHKLSIQ